MDKKQDKQIFTSYYARNSNNPDSIAISASIPEYYHGKWMKELGPSWKTLDNLKEGKYNDAEYIEAYLTDLKNRDLDPQKIWDMLPDGAILLCYERAGEFCHRRILAEWLIDNLGVDIPEWESEEERAEREAQERQEAVVDSLLEF